ncbi:MAG: AAA family ATPase [Pseudorhodoplanes sp.]|nr:AAA family ATPase [Pseudorhodoplanes sp.]
MTRDPTDDQAAVFAFLGRPDTFGVPAVERIDTHAAAVFLAGERAIKIKRAVKFPFLDFSTLGKRKAACEAEIEINRRFAPALYRGVVAIAKDDSGRLSLGGAGEPVEWAVEMRRFDENATLDRLADRKEIDAGLADALGRAVAAAHAAAPAVEAAPWIAALGDYIAQNERAFRERPDIFPPGPIDDLTARARRKLTDVTALLHARGARGLIRRGHGDMHLGNIVLIDGRPVLFDALEFNALVASGDVLYDLAFLLMDLVERALPAAASIAFNRYLAETGRPEDYDALAALPLFLSLRAAIRAKVTAAKPAAAGSTQAQAIARSARTYFDWAVRFLAPCTPTLIAVGGLSGTGKSVLARALAPFVAPAPGAVLLRSDVVRKTLHGRQETERLPGEAYRPEATRAVYATLIERATRILAAGHSTIADAVYATEAERHAIESVAHNAGAAFHGLFLTADLKTRIARVGARTADASDADAAVAHRQESYRLGTIGWTEVDASGTPEETLAKARTALGLKPD